MSQVGKVGGIWRVICERLLNAEQGAVVYFYIENLVLWARIFMMKEAGKSRRIF